MLAMLETTSVHGTWWYRENIEMNEEMLETLATDEGTYTTSVPSGGKTLETASSRVEPPSSPLVPPSFPLNSKFQNLKNLHRKGKGNCVVDPRSLKYRSLVWDMMGKDGEKTKNGRMGSIPSIVASSAYAQPVQGREYLTILSNP